MSPSFSPLTAGSPPNSSISRGGRPLDWNESRSRKLVRIYLFSNSQWPVILEALRERNWDPQKDAANKILNNLLGNDPRWLRPKKDSEINNLMQGLRNSTRPVQRQPQKNGLTRFDQHQPSSSRTSYRGTTSHEGEPQSHELYGYSNGGVGPEYSTDIKQLARQDSVFSTSSIASSFIERLSSIDVKPAVTPAVTTKLWKLCKRYTLPKTLDPSSCTTTSPQPPLSAMDWSLSLTEESGNVDLYASDPVLPGDFVNPLNRSSSDNSDTCGDPSSRAHSTNNCWCVLGKGSFIPSLLPTLPCGDPAAAWTMADINTSTIDDFGHTHIHLLASLDGYQNQLLNLVNSAIRSNRPALYAKNTASQTFLHVLSCSWFQPDSLLEQLIDLIKRNMPQLLLEQDTLGRNVFHNMRKEGVDFQRVQNLASGLDESILNRRDAFKRMPLQPPPTPLVRSVRKLINAARILQPPQHPQPQNESDSRILAQTKLLKIINGALGSDVNQPNPAEEDSEGRNGYHALAHVVIGWELLDVLANKGRKRKRPSSEGIDKKTSPKLSPKIEHLETLITVGADINHYDHAGNTALMAFIINVPDMPEKQDAARVRTIIRRLAEAGADIEKRNRRGETALHIAARHGQKVALSVLLELGANPFARNSDGYSVLDIIDRMYQTSESNPVLLNSLEACRALLTRADSISLQSPTFHDEWTFGIRRP